jgi:hypothetical protein
MNKLIDSQLVDEPGAPETYATPEKYEEAVAAYNKALADRPTLSLFDITYRGHMYQMNADRMIRTVASKNYLTHAYNIVSEAIISLDENDYSTSSWEALTIALDFAETVLADNSSDLRQTKVNTARSELIAAYKGLAEKVPADYTQLDAAIEIANRIYETEGYEAMYTGLEALEEAYNAAIAIDRNLDSDSQAIIDDAAAALNQALDAVAVLEGVQVVDDDDVLAEVGYGAGLDEDGNFGWRPEKTEFATAVDEDTGEALQMLKGLIYETDEGLLDVVLKGEYTYEAGEKNSSGMLATGDRIYDANGNLAMTIVMYGDANGDGAIDIGDVAEIAYMCDWMLEECEYGGIYTTAADVIADESVDISDYSEVIYLIEYLLAVDVYTFPQDGTYGQ